ncbi:hypothetical protein AA313_de0205898 [Arthrobotrys entomopaga]|nr:hypothetical protein AA313_de0205898 [Arthrobotrys entomopaga]
MTSWITRPLRSARAKAKASKSQQSTAGECPIETTDPTAGILPAESSQNGLASQADATIMRLPVELQAEILPYLNFYDQVRAGLTYPLWEQILAQKSFQATRYSDMQYRNATGYNFSLILTSDIKLICRLIRDSKTKALKFQLCNILMKFIDQDNHPGTVSSIDMMNHKFLDDLAVKDIPEPVSNPKSTDVEKKRKLEWLLTSVGYIYKDSDTWIPKLEIPAEELERMTVRDFLDRMVWLISNPENLTLDQALALPPSNHADEAKMYSINIYPRAYNFGLSAAGADGAEKIRYHLCLGMDIN